MIFFIQFNKLQIKLIQKSILGMLPHARLRILMSYEFLGMPKKIDRIITVTTSDS